MNVTTLSDLNYPIAARLFQNASEALAHGVQSIPSGEARIIQVGTAAFPERWRCVQDHGFGQCGQALLTTHEVGILLGGIDDIPLDEPAGGWLMVEDLDPVLGFVKVELFHHRHVLLALREQEASR